MEDRDSVPIREIGGIGSSSLSLRGTVLVHRSKSWAGRSSVFIPIECVSISRSWRFDGRFLIRGLKAVIVTLAVVAVISVPLLFLDKGAAEKTIQVLTPFYVIIAALGVGYVTYALVRFLRRYPTVRFDANVDDGHLSIECWSIGGARQELERLVRKVHSLQRKIDELIPYPVHMSYELFQMRPWRVSVLQAMVLVAVLYVPVRWLAEWYAMPYLYLFLALPVIVYIGRFVMDRGRLYLQPSSLREAVKDYERDDFQAARGKLDGLLAKRPSHLPALMLHAQVCTLLDDFYAAFASVDAIEQLEPELGDMLRDEILSIQKLQRRMDMDV